MDEKLKSVIEKINKLRALATSSNPHEAASAAARAAALIDEHQLSEAQLEAVENRESPQVADDPILRGKVMSQWKVWLVHGLAEHFGVYSIRQVRRGGEDDIKLTGRARDVEIVRYFFTWLSAEVERLCKANKPPSCGMKWTVTYRNGVSHGICVKLKEMKRAEAAARVSTTAAMVYLDSRFALAREVYVKSMAPGHRISATKGCYGSDPNAFDQGVRDGKAINLGAQLGGGDGSSAGPRLMR